MIRRPVRTALHSALSALAGGFRGVSIQQQQEEQRQQRQVENQRAALRTSLDLADRGAVRLSPPPDDEFESAVPMPDVPPPNLGMAVEHDGGQYVVPSLDERNRRESARRMETTELEREPGNQRAYGALRIVDPTFASEYDPGVAYDDVLRYRLRELSGAQSDTDGNGTAGRGLTPGQQSGEDQKERTGLGLVTEFGNAASAKYTPDERTRFWAAFTAIQRQNPQVSIGRAAFDAFQSLSIGTQQSVRRDPTEPKPDDYGREVDVAAPPGFTPPVTGGAAPATPAPVVPPRLTPPVVDEFSDADYERAFDALGPDASDEAVTAWLRNPANRRPSQRTP